MRFDPVDPMAREQASSILACVRDFGKEGLLNEAVRLKDIISKEDKYLYSRNDLEEAFKSLPAAEQVHLCVLIYHIIGCLSNDTIVIHTSGSVAKDCQSNKNICRGSAQYSRRYYCRNPRWYCWANGHTC